MFSNNINTLSRERFVKKGAGVVVINNENNSNNKTVTNKTINNNNNNTKKANNEKSTQQKQQQQQQNNITKDNSNIKQRLNLFSNQFYYNFNHCIKMLLVQQK